MTAERHTTLAAELALLETLPVPECADADVFALLKAELAGMLRNRGEGKIISAPPMTSGSAATLTLDTETNTLSWGYCCLGDYNQNSLVEVADITPMGVHWGEQSPAFPSPFPPDTLGSVVDGNANGMIEIADITPVGQNYGVLITAYNIYASTSPSDYPADAADDNGGAVLLGSVPFPEGPPPQGQRRMFTFTLSDPQPGSYFWVRPTDGTSEGTASCNCYLEIISNNPPVAKLSADPLLGDVPMVVEFNAALSYDPDGEIVKYEWDWDGEAGGWEWIDTGTESSQQHEYTEIADVTATVRVTDDVGDSSQASVLIRATAPGNDPPVVILTATPAAGGAPLDVSFDATGSYDPDGLITDMEWDFDGDGEFDHSWHELSAADSPLASCPYHWSGSFEATVRVSDDGGGQATASRTITVTDDGVRGDWWMFGHDPRHTNRSAHVGPQTDNVKVNHAMHAAVDSSAAFDSSNTVYIGDCADKLLAIQQPTGLQFTFYANAQVASSPALDADGTVYVGCWDKHLYAINQNGSVKWSYTLGDRVWFSSPVIGWDGTIYIGCYDDNLYAFNPDGSLQWTFTTGNDIESSPAIGLDSTIFFGSWDGYLYAVNPDGTLKWSYETGCQNSSPAIADDGTIYMGGHHLHAVNPDGSLKWEFTDAGGVNNSPAIALDGTVYVGSANNNLYAVNPDGSQKWAFPAEGAFLTSSPAVGADGTIYAVNRFDQNIYAISAAGAEIWSHKVWSADASPAIDEAGVLWVGSHHGDLWAFGPSD